MSATVLGYGGDIQLDQSLKDNLDRVSYRDRYPAGLDLRPDSELHGRLVNRVMWLAQQSAAKVQSRYSVWDSINEQLTCYIDLSAQQTEDEDKEGYIVKKPVHVVVPMQYAIRETLLTYLVAAFFEYPLLKYDWVGSEDVVKAMLMERAIEIQCRRAKIELNLYTQWSDNLTYGYGAVSTPWDERRVSQTRTESIYKQNMFGRRVKIGEQEVTEDVVSSEGNRLANIHPKLFLPDANVSIHDVQRSEAVGWVLRSSLVRLLEEEQNNRNVFNVEYIRNLAMATSSLMPTSTAGDKTNSAPENAQTSILTRPVDRIYMYVNLIPKDWGLGSGRYPEKWLFGVVGDKILVQAQPLGLNHGMYPLAVCASEFDGYATTPISKLETVHEMQKVIDWLFTSHVANVRKSINDMIIFDPSIIRQDDLENPTPGMMVRTRESYWGSGSLSNAIMQLNVHDVTQNHISNGGMFADMMNNATGAVDSVRGIMRGGSERRSAQEARDTHVSALSRLARMAKMISLQSMQDIATLFAWQTQQLISKSVFTKITETLSAELREEFGVAIKPGRMEISPDQLDINVDVLPHDGTVPGGSDIQAMLQAYQVAATNPLIAQKLDMTRLYLYIMRESGARNIEQFKLKTRVAGPEEIQQEAQAGNFQPLPGGGNASFSGSMA